MANEIKCRKEVLKYENPWVKVYFDDVEAPDPRVKQYNRIVESNGKQGVAVIPIYRNSIGLVRVFRYPIGKEVWEVPRGFGDSGNSSFDAQREIAEETTLLEDGYQLIELGTMHPNSGLLANDVVLFAAVCSWAFPNGKPEDPEIIEFKWFGMDSVTSMTRDGVLTDGFTYTTILRAVQEGLLEI